MRVGHEVLAGDFARSLDLLTPLAVVAATTTVWGSLRAVFQDDPKKRLAYATVSQVS